MYYIMMIVYLLVYLLRKLKKYIYTSRAEKKKKWKHPRMCNKAINNRETYKLSVINQSSVLHLKLVSSLPLRYFVDIIKFKQRNRYCGKTVTVNKGFKIWKKTSKEILVTVIERNGVKWIKGLSTKALGSEKNGF